MKRLVIFSLFFIATYTGYAQKAVTEQEQHGKQATIPSLKLYPKTTDKSLNIYVELPKAIDIVISMPGTERNNPVSWEMNARSSYQKSIDVSHLPEGVYTIKVDGVGVALKDSFTVRRH